MKSSILLCPKYLWIAILMIIYINFQTDAKWKSFKWIVLVGGSVFGILSILFNRFKLGLTIKGVLFDLVWLFVYINIIRVFAPEYKSKEELQEHKDADPIKFAKIMNTFAIIALVLSLVIIVLCILQVVPFANVVAIPLLRGLSFVL
jgi:hypothetical protein